MAQESFDERLIWLLQVSRSMLATRDLDRLLALITDAFVEASEADRGFLLLKDRDSGKLVQRVGRGSEGNDVSEPEARISSVANRVFKEKQPIFATDTAAQNDLAARRSVDELRLKMMVCVPLVSDSEVLGVIYADGKTSLDKVFTQTNRRTLEMLADHAAAAIENARMFERATNDPLTGLPNSSYFLLQLAKAMREANKVQAMGVLLIDIDSFKRVNIAAGAEAGDRALVDLGNTLAEVARADGLVARYGSDKFGVLLPAEEGSIAVRMRDVAERCRAAVATKTYHGVQLSASIGGLSFPGPDVTSAPDLVALADDQLAKARARGQGEVE
ncbi:MAG: diguanylate cyclase, partial [Deltaproteobacteria bacterium]|nr:diguanylate cyclase [Deltaproteobacteria bacterium]